MGSTFQTKYIQCIPKDEVSRIFANYIRFLEQENGSAGRFVETGEFDALISEEIVFTDNRFDDIESAKDWLKSNHHKWKPPLAVKVIDGWLIGGWCPS